MTDNVLAFPKKDLTPKQPRANMKPIPDQFKGGRLLNAIIENQNITGIGQAILFDITRFCDLGENATFQEWIWRKREDLVEGTKFDIKAINRHIKILIEDGYINKRKGTFKGKQAANEYQLTSKIFDEYLTQLGHPNTDTHKLTGYPNTDTQGYPNADTQGYPNADTNHNDSHHNNEQHNELKNKQKENSEVQKSGENPLDPYFFESDYSFGFKKTEEEKPKRTKADVFRAGQTAIREKKGQKFLSREEKSGMIQALLDEYDIDKVFDFFDKTNKSHQAAPYDIKLLKLGIEYAATDDPKTV